MGRYSKIHTTSRYSGIHTIDGVKATWLQNVGYVAVKPIEEFRKGDTVAYNHGGTGIFISKKEVSPKFWEIVVKEEDDGKTYHYKVKKGTLKPYYEPRKEVAKSAPKPPARSGRSGTTTPTQNITTATYRKMAWDARERGEWAKAAKYYKLALKHYPKHHAGSQMAIEDKAKLQRLLDEVQGEAQTATPKPPAGSGLQMQSSFGGGGGHPDACVDLERAKDVAVKRKKVPYFTISKAERLIAENFTSRSDKQLHTDIIKLRDYIRYIEVGDREVLMQGGYFKQVAHPDASGVSPANIFLHQNLKYTLERAYAEKDKRVQEQTKPKRLKCDWWKIPRDQWVDGHVKSPAMHWECVRLALARGYKVPAKVLKDYPDLVKKPAVPDVPTKKMYDDLDAAIAGGFTAKPKRTRVTQREYELEKTLREWGKGVHTVPPALAPVPKRRKTAAKPTTKPKAKKPTTPKPRKKAAKAKNGKAAPKLTTKQQKHLNETGSVMIKRGGKFITVTG